MNKYIKETYIPHFRKNFTIINYDEKYKNKIRTYAIQVLMEEVNDENLEYEWNYLTEIVQNKIIDDINNKIYILVENDILYGYIKVCIYPLINQAILKGFYIEKIIRNMGFGKELLNKVITYCKNNNCSILLTEVAEYSISAIQFYKKFGFYLDNVTYENEGKLKIYHYYLAI